MSWKRILLPAPPDIVFLLFLLTVPLIRGYQAINTDGDLGRHIRVGETILEDRSLMHVDRFSHTMAGQPFVPYEWLSEVAFAAAYRLGGLAGVLLLTALVLAASYAAIALFLQRSGVSPLPSFAVAVTAGLVGAVHWLARPHIFSLAGAIATLWVLERGGRNAPWATLGIYALWANLHGGFLYGLILIGLYLAGDVLELQWGGDAITARSRLRNRGVCLAAALAGTLLNPSGPALLAHVTGYLGKSYLVDGTAEYQSPDFHLLYGRIFLVVLCGVIGAIALAGLRPSYARLLAILANVAFALVSLRNIPLFGMVALPVVALHLMERGVSWPGALLRRLDMAFSEVARTTATGAWSLAGTAALAAAVLAWPGPDAGLLRQVGFDRKVFPVEAVARAREAGLGGNLFNEFAWGGYILLAWPGQPVFIDGQTDFYGESLTREYVAIRNAEPGWSDRLKQRDIRLVLLPPEAPLLRQLRSLPEWRVWSSDPTAVILVRNHPAGQTVN